MCNKLNLIKMTKQELTSKIDEALNNFEMSHEVRELLILLKNEIPKAKSTDECVQLVLKWGELITKAVFIFSQ